MRSRAVTLLALALSLPASACAPTGFVEEPPPEHDEAPPRARTARVGGKPLVRSSVAIDPACGVLSLAATGPWTSEGDRFEQVRGGWHPRAEHGRPVALREARSPLPHRGLDFLQVRVDGSPTALQPCFVRPTGDAEALAPLECMPLWTVVQGPAKGRPQTNEAWSELVGLLDGASAVYSTPTQLERCVTGLPPAVLDALPPLRREANEHESRATFVERIDVSPRLTTLVLVSAVQPRLDEGLTLERTELWTLDREEAR